jgi:hypothetical protein
MVMWCPVLLYVDIPRLFFSEKTTQHCFRQIWIDDIRLPDAARLLFNALHGLRYGERSRSSVARKSNLCARIATVDLEANVPLSELSMLERRRLGKLVGVNPDSDAAHVCLARAGEEASRRPC